MRRTILATMPLEAHHREAVEQAAPAFRLVVWDEQQGRQALTDAARVAEVWFGGRIDPELFAAAGRLRWIQTISAGVDRYMFPELVASDVTLTNVRGMHAATIADHVYLLMLALNRNLKPLIHQQAAGRWAHRPVRELAGDTLAVIGLGGIGREVARRAAAFGMRAIGTRRSGQPVPEADQTYAADRLGEVLTQAQWVVLACPLTPQTHGLIDAQALRQIGPGGHLINIGRGELVDEPALVRALREGTIAGAALDVFVEEPLPVDHPLWYLPNALLTPHLAGSMTDYLGRATRLFCGNLERYLAGEPLINVVDTRLGY